ncbi:hypothetical protein ALP64_201186 [Pseudomonas syringae pv. actinidiae]|nr:hypothetical protein ALP64_201186 [Pseudomonas syringae pv. actinidiae]
MRRVDGHIGCPRFENRQQTDQGFQAAARNDGNTIIRAHAVVDQAPGQCVGVPIELRVGQVLPLKRRRHCIWKRPRLSLDAPMNQRLIAEFCLCLVPVLQVQLLGRCQQLEIIDLQRRAFNALLQNMQQAPGDSLCLGIVDPGPMVDHVQRGVVVEAVAAQMNGQRRRFKAIGDFYRFCLGLAVAVGMVFQLVGDRDFKQLGALFTG